MPVHSLSIPSGTSESPAKLLNSNSNSEQSSNGLSFNATMNKTASEYGFDDQRYLLSDGQVLTAEQLLEMLENGNSLPGMNLPTISDLQHYKIQTEINTTNKPALLLSASDKVMFLDNVGNSGVQDKFVLTPQQLLNQQLAQNQIMKPDIQSPEQFLLTFNAVKMVPQQTVDTSINGFTAIYGYHMSSAVDGSNSLLTNSFNISTPVQHPQWNQSLGQSVQWMVNQNIQQAEIKLNPPDLGLLDIRISVTNDQATVNFSAANAAVREALESAIPRLREMLEQSGLSLADVNVSEHSLEQNQQQADSDESASTAMNDDGTMATSSELNQNLSSTKHIGLLDIYA